MKNLSIIRSFPSLRRKAEERPGGGEGDMPAAALLRSFEESRHGWLWSTDAAGRLTYVSAGFPRSLDLDPGELRHAMLADLFLRPDAESGVRQSLPLLMNRRAGFERITLQAGKDGKARWWQLSGCPQHDAAGDFAGYHGYAIDVTDQRESSETASQMAMYDPLTGLPNRRHMVLELEAGLRRIGQLGGACAVMLIDLDRFK